MLIDKAVVGSVCIYRNVTGTSAQSLQGSNESLHVAHYGFGCVSIGLVSDHHSG